MTITHAALKKAFLESGYEIQPMPRRQLERMALDAPYEVKRHQNSNIMGLIMPDEGVIGLADDLSVDEKAETLIHETIHLADEAMPEDEVEALTVELVQGMDPKQFGFWQFLVQ